MMFSKNSRTPIWAIYAGLIFLCGQSAGDDLTKPQQPEEISNSSGVPSVFWASEPVMPDETVYLQGDLLEKGSVVELAELTGKPGKGPSVKST